MMHPIERLRYIARADGEPAASLAMEAAYTLGELSQYEPNAVLTACRRLLDKHPDCGPLWWLGARLVGAADPYESAQHAAAELCSDPTPGRLAEALRASYASGDVIALGPPMDIVVESLSRARMYSLRLVGSPWLLRRVMRAVAGLEQDREVVGYSAGEEDAAVSGAAVVVVEALAAGKGGYVLTGDSAALAEAAAAAAVPVWVAVGVGRALPPALLEAVVARVSGGEQTLEIAVEAEAVLVPPEAFKVAVGPEGRFDPSEAGAEVTCPPGLELVRRLV